MAVVANDDPTVGAYNVSHQNTLTVTAPGILSNDSYGTPPPNPTIQVIHSTLHGTLTVNADGSFLYDPDNSYVGFDAFYYNLSQGGVTSIKPAVVMINVTNSPPVVYNDAMMTPKNTNVVANLVSPNDTDPDPGDIAAAVIHSITLQPSHGSVTFTGKNANYTPNTGYVGQDTFKYKAVDALGAVSTNDATVTVTIYNMLTLDVPPVISADTPAITQEDLALLASEAARRWVLAGVDPETARKALAGTQFVIADLPGSMLGAEMPERIVIDVNAAGYGWFVDASPSSDDEFDVLIAPSERQASRGSAAFGRADLLTALEHEFGHALGMDHPDGDEFAHSVMHETLSLSTRRIPTAADKMAADEYYAELCRSGSTIQRRKW